MYLQAGTGWKQSAYEDTMIKSPVGFKSTTSGSWGRCSTAVPYNVLAWCKAEALDSFHLIKHQQNLNKLQLHSSK